MSYVLSMSKILERKNMNGSSVEPEKKSYSEKIDFVRKQLLDSGYGEFFPELFHEICDYAARFLLGCEPHGLLLMGSCGIGKTEGVRRLSAILQIDYVTVEMIISAFGSSDYYKMIDGTDFFGEKGRDLIIDELGTEVIPYVYYGTRYNVMEDVLYSRYNAFKDHGSRTIITTNKTLNELRELYGARVSDRFWESCRIREFTGESLRKNKPEKRRIMDEEEHEAGKGGEVQEKDSMFELDGDFNSRLNALREEARKENQ